MVHFELFGRLKKKKQFYQESQPISRPLIVSMPSPPVAQSQARAMPGMPMLPKQPAAPTAPQQAVVRVLELSNQGMSEADIISTLQTEGFTFEEIDAALTEALKSEVSGEPGEYGLKKGFDFTSQLASTERENLSPLPQEGLGAVQLTAEEIINRKFEDMQELVESLIEDKVGKAMDAVSEQKEKMQQIDARLKAIQTSLDTVQKSLDSVKKQMDDTKNEIESKVAEVEPRLNSLERAFRDVVPNIVDSMREIKEVVHGHIESSEKQQPDPKHFSEYHS